MATISPSATIPDTLPDDIESCHGVIKDARALIELLSADLEQYKHRIDYLLRRLFGSTSERIDPDQLHLFKEALEQAQEASAAVEEEPETPPRAKGKGHGRQRLPEDLPRTRIEYDIPEEEKTCPNGHERVRIGEDVSEQLDFTPASYFVIEHVRPVYACVAPDCDCGVIQASKPAQPIEKGLAGPGLLAHIITSKYCDHCVPAQAVHEMRVWPLAAGVQALAANRLERRWSRAKVVSVKEKARRDRVRCELERRAKANLPMKCRNSMDDVKTGEGGCSGISVGVTCLLPARRPALRRRESSSGSCMEAGNLSSRCKGRNPSGGPTRVRVPMRGTGAESSVVAMKVL